ncbi:hypothetical protein EON64_11705 [archaeon]|nr:MAG: hypothetical protein EON64_11705 [archaeon]
MSSEVDHDQAKAKKAGRKRKKQKKQVIELSLWINGCKYEFGLLCTFCTKQPAICHCPECTDFYCQSCDSVAHNTKKRKHHVRSKLPHLDMQRAAGLITCAVRRYGHIKLLQKRCREVFTRHFDKQTLNYYYYNPVYGTTSWRKPYCLRNEELFPFMSPYYAACKMQNLYHLFRAREKSRALLLSQYRKVFDRTQGRFYYAFHGRSYLLPRSSWRRPRLLGRRSFPKDLQPVYTPDVAALVVQRKWRSILLRQFFRALVRASYDEVGPL